MDETGIGPEGARGDLEFGTIGRLAREAARRFGTAHAIEDGGVTLTYEDLAAAAERAAAALAALGVRPGDRVAIWAPNLWEWIVAALGVHLQGAVLVPINTRFKGEEAAELLSRSRARVLFTLAGFLGLDYPEMLARAGVELPALEAVVLLRGSSRRAPGRARLLSFPDLLASAGAGSIPRAERVSPDDPCDILYTSGTTGRAKGVICSHAQALRAFRDWSLLTGLRAGDRYLIVAPFFHGFGYKAGWLAALLQGATILPQAIFDASAVLARIGDERVTVLPGPPALYQSLLLHPARSGFDLSSLRLAVTGAAMIPVELIHRMHDELRFRTVLTGYGLTEATGVSTLCRAGDDPEIVATTSGRAIPGVEVRVADDAGEAVPPGEPGEVLVRGYTVMRGYFEDPEETARAIDARGWLRTGDIGVLDARGYLRITDRKKDLYIVGGLNVYPAEVEAVLLRHAGVAQAAVVGMPDARLGEVGLAYVVLKPGASAAAGELIAFCAERLANYKVPRRVELVSSLPTNASGKVLKYVLRERARVDVPE